MNKENETGIDAVVAGLVAKHPVSGSMVEFGNYIGYPTAGAVYVAKSRGEFPLRVIRTGAGLRVMTSDLIDFIRTGISQSEKRLAPAQYKGVGRTTKAEEMEAAARGITVRELRAQAVMNLGGA